MKCKSWLVFHLLAVAALIGLPNSLLGKAKWEPVLKADLESTKCVNFPGVAAEELFKYQTLNADGRQAWNEYYLRRKVYNAKAAQEAGVLNIEYERSHSVNDLAARVIKVDGTTVELQSKDFRDSVVAKNKDVKIKAKSVAVPNLESGDIVEYQWSETADGDLFQPQSWFIQSVYPTRRFTFTLKRSLIDCNVLWFNVANAKVNQMEGMKVLTVTDIPPYETEPFTPPERDLRGAVVIINVNRWARWWGKESLWRDLSAAWGEDFHYDIKPTGEIKKLANEIIGQAGTDEQKLALLYDYVRNTVTNLDYFDDADLQKARKKLEKATRESSPSDILNAKSGYSVHLNKLFASLCVAAGYNVRVNWSTSRTDMTNIKHDQGFVFLNYHLVAVKVKDTWKYYSPGDYYVPASMVDWKYELAPGLLCEPDPRTPTFVSPAPASAAASEELRTGTLALNEEGDCEGPVKISYTGHCAVAKKLEWHGKTKSEIEKLIRDDVASRIPTAEVSEFEFVNIKGIGEPTTVSYQLKLPGYAEAAGDRLIFAPAVFQKGVAPLFKGSTRTWPISFPYSWRTKDEISIKLPPAYELDSPSAPRSFGRVDDPFRAQYKIAMRKKDGSLIYSRDVSVGDGGLLNFPATSYGAIKDVFDALVHADEHTLIIKPKDTAEAVPSSTDSAKKS